jgi:hypothetical protein
VETINLSGTTSQNRGDAITVAIRGNQYGRTVDRNSPNSHDFSGSGSVADSAAGRDFLETSLDTPAFSVEFSAILGPSFCMTIGGALC